MWFLRHRLNRDAQHFWLFFVVAFSSGILGNTLLRKQGKSPLFLLIWKFSICCYGFRRLGWRPSLYGKFLSIYCFSIESIQGSSILSPSSAYDPVYDARTISWVFLFIVFVMILICVGGVGCCLFFIWKNRTPEQKDRPQSWTPSRSSYVIWKDNLHLVSFFFLYDSF